MTIDNMPKRKSYDQLSIVPHIVAHCVCGDVYNGDAISNDYPSFIATIESLRQEMTQEQRNEFIETVDKRCRFAYDSKIDWFVKIAKGGNMGRDTLYDYVRHWLASYLNNRSLFMLHSKESLNHTK